MFIHKALNVRLMRTLPMSGLSEQTPQQLKYKKEDSDFLERMLKGGRVQETHNYYSLIIN